MRQKKLALVSLVLVFCCTLILAACQNQVTVTYSYNGGIISSTVNKGDCATPPTYNVPDGYEIVWYDDIDFKTKWDLTAPVTEDITLFGKLEAKPVQITFVKNGETVDTASVPAADRIVYPAISGNTATIWYEDEAATKIWKLRPTRGQQPHALRQGRCAYHYCAGTRDSRNARRRSYDGKISDKKVP